MDCQQLRERVLEALDEPRSAAIDAAVDAHASSCPDCARFIASQRALDDRLARAMRAPVLSPAFRSNLRSRMRRERARVWMDALPDIVHFASCAVATLVCAAVAPLATPTVFAGGAAIALSSYVVLAAVRTTFTEIEQPDR
jgi:anti-sigma factor RsiW